MKQNSGSVIDKRGSVRVGLFSEEDEEEEEKEEKTTSAREKRRGRLGDNFTFAKFVTENDLQHHADSSSDQPREISSRPSVTTRL